MPSAEKPILFHYAQSIYSHRVLWYLWLRGIAYDECIQPYIMPRPDLASIDVNYRRIPIMAIGKDIYCDSRLIIQKLEERFPNSTLTPSPGTDAGIRKLLENWTIDGGIFANSVKAMPFWNSKGSLQDPKFIEDRQELSGGFRMTAEQMQKGRPSALAHLRQAFELLETTFLADGRKWILGTEGPTTADIDGVWPLEWLIVDPGMKGSLSEESFNETVFPKTFAYVKRFMEEVDARKAERTKPMRLDGGQMKKRVTGSSQTEPTHFIADDPLQFQQGDQVEVYASDYGSAQKDRGALIGLTTTEVVIRNSQGLHLHFPRWNFRVDKIQPKAAIPPSISKTPNMRLIYHPNSPFTRKVFMVAIELGLAQSITLQKVVVCPIPFPGWSDNNDEVAVYNPMAKIPCLVTEEVPGGIYDSRIICEYLESTASVNRKKDSQYWQIHTLHACADGIMDAGVLLAYEKRIREPRGVRLDEWVGGQKTKINRALDRLDAAVKQGILDGPPSAGPASADQIAVAAAVAFVDQMGLEWRGSRSSLAKWLAGWEKRTSFMETLPDTDWNGANAKNGSKM